jgi:hypothetical protein
MVMGFRIKSQATRVVSVVCHPVGLEDVLESRLPEAVFRPSPFQPKSDFWARRPRCNFATRNILRSLRSHLCTLAIRAQADTYRLLHA